MLFSMNAAKISLEVIFIKSRVVVVYFILSRLSYLAYSVNLGLLCMLHPGVVPLV